MTAPTFCEEHGLLLEIVCTGCQKFLCIQCLDDHDYAAHNGKCISLIKYAKESLLPFYANALKELEGKSASNLTKLSLHSSLPNIVTRLVAIKKDIEGLLGKLANAVNELQECLDYAPKGYEELKEGVRNDIANLTKAISKKDIKYIIEVAESAKGGIAATNLMNGKELPVVITTINQISEVEKYNKVLETLQQNIAELIKQSQNTLKPQYPFIPEIVNKSVYFTCYAIEGRSKLCKFDTVKKKVTAIVAIPQFSSIGQIGTRVFISGGNVSAVTNSMYEYIENKNALIAKSPMKYAKHCHNMTAISGDSLATIGGHNGSGAIAYCEEYLIGKDCWSLLPSLIYPRYYSAVSMYNHSKVYAIGGYGTDTIEVLDLKKKTVWELVNLLSNEVNLSKYPCAAQVGSDKILILCGDDTKDAGIWNVEAATIKKITANIKPGCYYEFGTMHVVHGIAYAIGGYHGGISTYSLKDKTFDGFDLSKVYM
eukprot:TRINITY_DN106812_c0_g1_i1.p1 TRINITY_DN106812_c0_g1~~TRINITY_DN106812_c0_g1_i1.p1  ORF type:complete len:483 (-),score=54.80 TRINITY_DN106812_c0_g1_i1:386-1834(-)